MTQTDIILKPIDRVLPLFKNAKEIRSGRGGYIVCCSAHNDRNPSLMVWEDQSDSHVGLMCFAGCSRQAIVESIGLTEADLYINGKASQPAGGIELFDLAADKLIHPGMLANLGVTDAHTFTGKRAVHIPYYTMDGKPYERYRIRTALTAVDGSAWNKIDAPLIPYGLDHLASAREAKYLILPEGESDCWSLWSHGLPALGIPGIEHYNKLKLEYLAGIENLYIIQEPPSEEDIQKRKDPGKRFVENTYKHLLAIGYKGKVYAIDLHSSVGVKDPNDLHKRDRKAFKTVFEHAMSQAKSLSPVSILPETRSFKELMAKELPPIQWIVRGMIPEGLTILGGKQKLGKSWLLLALGLAVSIGGLFLGSIKVDRSEVLYLALEDNERRLQDRLRQLLSPGASVPDGFHYATRWPRLDIEGLQLLNIWLDEHPKVKLVIIDTWGRAKPISRAKNGYDADVDAASGVQTLAIERNISLLATCHLRKMSAEDALDELNATTGLSATADNILILKRERGNADASLFGTGREIELDKALSFNDGFWKLLGDGPEYRLSQASKEVVDAINKAGKPLYPRDIAEALGIKDVGKIRKRLFDMKERVEIIDTGKGYIANRGNGGNGGNTSNGGNGGNAPASLPLNGQSVTSNVTALPLYENEVTPINRPVVSLEDYRVTSVTSVTNNGEFNISSNMTEEQRQEHELFKQREYASMHPDRALLNIQDVNVGDWINCYRGYGRVTHKGPAHFEIDIMNKIRRLPNDTAITK
jgi:hypothetical protein